MTPALFACTAVCGALGAMARGHAMDKLRPMLPVSFPWTTMVVNIAACYFIGLINGHGFFPAFQTMACTGFLGGFSTMSTLNDDALSLLRNSKILRFIVYLGMTYGCCLIGCMLGIYAF